MISPEAKMQKSPNHRPGLSAVAGLIELVPSFQRKGLRPKTKPHAALRLSEHVRVEGLVARSG
jgi:hypothetical protein